jgi:PAS domain S-box-containing protein
MKMHALPSQEHSKGEILIVEDTPASLKLLSDLLTEAGYYVRQAPNGELALWTAASRPPELILLDVRMPGIDGFEVCRSLKQSEALRDIPVIFLSAQYDTDDKVRGFGLGAVDFIAKPFQAEEILARTDTHVRLARAQRQLAQERAGLKARVRERTAQLAAAASRVQEELRQRRANEESLRLAGQVFDATLDAIFVTDARGRLLIVNPAFTRLTGYTQAEVIGKGPSLVRADAADATYRQMLRDVVAHGHWSGEIMGRHKDGASHPGMLSVSAARDADGVLRNYVAVFMDISERKAERRLIDFLQWHDALTGLPNASASTPAWPAAPRARKWPCCASTWTASRASTTPSATSSATARCRRWPTSCARRCAMTTPSRARAATNSSSSCATTPASNRRRPPRAASWPACAKPCMSTASTCR